MAPPGRRPRRCSRQAGDGGREKKRKKHDKDSRNVALAMGDWATRSGRSESADLSVVSGIKRAMLRGEGKTEEIEVAE